MNRVTLAIIWIFFCFFIGAKNSSADWQSDLEGQFDIVETFNDLQDWRGINDLHGYDFEVQNQPKKLDGSNSIWDFYDEWSYSDPADDWIKDHGVNKVWKRSVTEVYNKSLRLDLTQDSSVARYGPSRFGLYYGSSSPGVANPYATSGLSNSGYYEQYVFLMVKIPNNRWPTNNGLFYPNHDSYIWPGYDKFLTFCTSFTAPDLPGNATTSTGNGCRWEYGCSDYLLQLLPCGSACTSQYEQTYTQSGLNQVYDEGGSYGDSYYREEPLKSGGAEDFLSEQIAADKWFGIEVHLTRGTPDGYDGHIDVWLYDEVGNSRLIYAYDNLLFMAAGKDWAFNKWFVGGNINYYNYIIPKGLDVTYYVDDIIIDGERIGPTYFNLLGLNADMTAPASPSGLNII